MLSYPQAKPGAAGPLSPPARAAALEQGQGQRPAAPCDSRTCAQMGARWGLPGMRWHKKQWIWLHFKNKTSLSNTCLCFLFFFWDVFINSFVGSFVISDSFTAN